MTPHDLSPSSITEGLSTCFIGQRILYYPRLTSTMDIARREAGRGAVDGTVIIAGEQTGGRGRLRRAWYSPAGNIALSLVLYPELTRLPYLIMVASLAVVNSIEAVTGLKARIKWPNDILIDGKKVCGILIENEVKGNRVPYSIVGVGINVGMRIAEYTDISAVAVSLDEASGKEISRVVLIQKLLTEFERLYLTLPAAEAVYEDWRARLDTMGKQVTVQSGGTVLEGVAESVDRNGTLLLRHADGSVTVIVAGDVILRHQ